MLDSVLIECFDLHQDDLHGCSQAPSLLTGTDIRPV